MQVGAIQNQSFSGAIRETKNGNIYEKSNEGKKLYPLIAAGTSVVGTSIILANLKNENNIEKIMGAIDSSEGVAKSEIKKVLELMNKPGVKAGVVGLAAACAALGGLIIGVIIDAIANGTRRNDADRFAELGEKPQKTNKGKLVCGSIGLGLGLLSLGSIQITQGMAELNKKAVENVVKNVKDATFGLKFLKAYKYAIIPSSIMKWVIFGAIYDYSVNKSRVQLAHKANIAAKNEANLDAKINAKIEEKIKAKFEDEAEEKFEESAAA